MEARRLEASGIIATAETLAARISDRFPDRGITRVAQDLAALSHETEERLARSSRPNWALRAGAAALIVLGLVILALAASQVRHGSDISGIDEWLSVLQNGIQDVVFLGIAVAFLLTMESRLRRRTMLAALHELRSVAHVIDMHQLTKDPDSARHPDLATPARRRAPSTASSSAGTSTTAARCCRSPRSSPRSTPRNPTTPWCSVPSARSRPWPVP
ncbi:hypothetical protein ACE2AJ_10980 [Aquihabitans daechungensis]|uniref:hypothetical protein n=1 Tax=Aquihabitans daechungensis TaxID=1052257 RepID=UPI003BA160F5